MGVELIWNLLLATLMDWFLKFPALFAATGVIVGGFVTGTVIWLIQRKYGVALTGATENLVGLQKKQLDTMKETAVMQTDAHERTLKMQKDHYEGELNEVRRKYESDLSEVKERCAGIETNLHHKRNELQGAQLEIAELKARPDLTTVSEMFSQQGRVMEKVSTTLDGVAHALHEHDQNLERRLQELSEPIKQGMERVVEAIKSTNNHKK